MHKGEPFYIPGYDPFATAEDCTFDPKRATKAVRWLETYISLTDEKNYGKPLKLEPWQRYLVETLFGWVKPDGSRRYWRAYIEVPRGNGKSVLIAALGLYLAFCEAGKNCRVGSVSSSSQQAKVIYKYAADMVRLNPKLAKLAQVTKTQGIIIPHRQTNLVPTHSEANTQYVPYEIVLFDELHAIEGRELWDVMTTNLRGKENPLLLAITTAGDDIESVCYEQHEYAKRVRTGARRDKTFLPCIFAADSSDDWTKVETWEKANPNLHAGNLLTTLERELPGALDLPTEEASFKRYHLNLWGVNENTWIPAPLWNACRGESDIEPHDVCYGGLDLSVNGDTSAFTLVFPKDGRYYLKLFVWLPEKRIANRDKIDKVNYRAWAKSGLIELIPGEVINYDFIANRILELSKEYTIRQIGYDKWNATQLIGKLQEAGLDCVDVPQGPRLSILAKEFERVVRAKELTHDGNPVLSWMLSNTTAEVRKNNVITLTKKSFRTRIDGVISTIMALDRAMTNDSNKPSVYSERGILVF